MNFLHETDPHYYLLMQVVSSGQSGSARAAPSDRDPHSPPDLHICSSAAVANAGPGSNSNSQQTRPNLSSFSLPD